MTKNAEIILHQDYWPLFQMLSGEQVAELMTALFKHQAGAEVGELGQAVGIVFQVITGRAKREKEAYDQISAIRSVNRRNKLEQNATNDDKAQQAAAKRHKPNPNPIPILEKEKEVKEKDSAPDGARTRFVPPTLEEVEAYCRERGNHVNAKKFFENYNASKWYRGNTKIKDWKACVRKWEADDEEKAGQAKRIKPNSFHNFEGREIDYDALLKTEGG